jgi:hypothetical protein
MKLGLRDGLKPSNQIRTNKFNILYDEFEIIAFESWK